MPETRPTELEQLIRERPSAITVDLAVRADGPVSTTALRLDGSRSRPLILRTAATANVTLIPTCKMRALA